MTRFSALFALAISFFLSMAVLASPIPIDAAPEAETDLEKRITHTGVATYFYQNGHAGACGKVHSDSTPLVATSKYFWNMNGSGNCGQYVKVTGLGKTHYAIVADECPECAEGHLDMSTGFFKEFTSNLGMGEFDISWNFMPMGFSP
ncbi:hypothetical protein DL93DRAFT_1574508 [Clavulina sp. PMI_390]|nr:hypothetical protein DL93DRAFT_1574508 [Clavulina sp. PMI_390]